MALKPSITIDVFLLHRKDKVIAGAAAVVRFEDVAAAAEGHAIRQVSKGAADGVS